MSTTQRCFSILGLLLCAGPAFASVSYVQSVTNFASNAETVNVTITGVGSHSALCAAFVQSITAGTFTGGTVTDNHSHTYTMSPSSPYGPVQTVSDKFVAGIACLPAAPSGSSTITWTASGVTGAIFCAVNVHELSYPMGDTFAFDLDALHTYPSNSLTSSPATLPAITPSATGEFLLAQFITDLGCPGAPGTPWTATSIGNSDSYVTSSSAGAASANFPDGTIPDSAGVLLVAFKDTRPASSCTPTLTLLHEGRCG